MCGYCIEGATLNFIKSELASEKMVLESHFVSNYLQESRDVLGIARKLKSFNGFSDSTDIIFYRMWEALICKKHRVNCQVLMSELDENAINTFFRDLKNNKEHKIWELLGDSKTYTDCNVWDVFIKQKNQKDQLIDYSEKNLRAYYDDWIMVEGKGEIDPIESTKPKDRDRFYSSFSTVYFSLLILLKYKNDSSIIKKIALTCPKSAPDFLSYDLWIQRKAFAVCVKKYGSQFILEHGDDVRIELVYYSYYSLIKESMNEQELVKDDLLSCYNWLDPMDRFVIIERVRKVWEDWIKVKGEFRF